MSRLVYKDLHLKSSSAYLQVRPAFARAACGILGLNPFKLPQDAVLSFAMAQHQRLGSNSCFFGMNEDLVQRIVDAASIFDTGKSSWARRKMNKKRSALARAHTLFFSLALFLSFDLSLSLALAVALSLALALAVAVALSLERALLPPSFFPLPLPPPLGIP